MLERVEEEVKKLYAHIPEALRMKETELAEVPLRESATGAGFQVFLERSGQLLV